MNAEKKRFCQRGQCRAPNARGSPPTRSKLHPTGPPAHSMEHTIRSAVEACDAAAIEAIADASAPVSAPPAGVAEARVAGRARCDGQLCVQAADTHLSRRSRCWRRCSGRAERSCFGLRAALRKGWLTHRRGSSSARRLRPPRGRPCHAFAGSFAVPSRRRSWLWRVLPLRQLWGAPAGQERSRRKTPDARLPARARTCFVRVQSLPPLKPRIALPPPAWPLP